MLIALTALTTLTLTTHNTHIQTQNTSSVTEEQTTWSKPTRHEAIMSLPTVLTNNTVQGDIMFTPTLEGTQTA